MGQTERAARRWDGSTPSPRPLLLAHAYEALRALSGVACQPCLRGGPNDAGHNRPAVPPQCLLYLPRHSPSAWASDLPHLPPTVTTLVFPRSRSPKKRRHWTPSPWSGERSDDACGHRLMHNQSIGYTTRHRGFPSWSGLVIHASYSCIASPTFAVLPAAVLLSPSASFLQSASGHEIMPSLTSSHVLSGVPWTFRLRSPRRPRVGPPHEVGVLERPLLLPRRYTTLSSVPVTSITITERIIWFLEFRERQLRSLRRLLSATQNEGRSPQTPLSLVSSVL